VQNETLRALAGLDTGDIVAVNALVRGRSASNIDSTVEIDVGSDAGIRVGDPVVAAELVLVGRVVEVSAGRARVRLVTDPGLSYGVRLVGPDEASIEQGLGAGDGTDGIDVTFIDPDADVRVGDLAVTGGSFEDTSLFPPDLVVGTVASTSVDPAGVNRTVKLEPQVRIDRLEAVAVLQYPPRGT
jgi:rod shape-determining protein MreC